MLAEEKYKIIIKLFEVCLNIKIAYAPFIESKSYSSETELNLNGIELIDSLLKEVMPNISLLDYLYLKRKTFKYDGYKHVMIATDNKYQYELEPEQIYTTTTVPVLQQTNYNGVFTQKGKIKLKTGSNFNSQPIIHEYHKYKCHLDLLYDVLDEFGCKKLDAVKLL